MSVFTTMLALWNVRDDRTLTASEVRVINALISWCGPNGTCNPALRTLAESARMRPATVMSTLRRLEGRPGPIVVKVVRATEDAAGAKVARPKRNAYGHIAGNSYVLAPGVGWSNYERTERKGVKQPSTPPSKGLPANDQCSRSAEPMPPICEANVPDRTWPGTVGTTEEDLLRGKKKSEEEGSPHPTNFSSSSRERERGRGGQTIPLSFGYSGDDLEWCQKLGLDVEATFREFVNSAIETKQRSADWRVTWRKYISKRGYQLEDETEEVILWEQGKGEVGRQRVPKREPTKAHPVTDDDLRQKVRDRDAAFSAKRRRELAEAYEKLPAAERAEIDAMTKRRASGE